MSNSNNNNDAPKFDNSHVSNHFLKGTYDHAITQKGNIGNNTFQSWTNVDKNGNVGDSGFGNFGTKKSK